MITNPNSIKSDLPEVPELQPVGAETLNRQAEVEALGILTALELLAEAPEMPDRQIAVGAGISWTPDGDTDPL